MSLPRLITPRLILEPATPADSADLAALETDPEVMRHLAGAITCNRADMTRRF